MGEEAGALIHQVVLMMAARTTAPAVARAIHAYPTLSESVKGALLGIARAGRVAWRDMDASVTEVIAVTDKAARRIAALALKEGRALPILRVRVTAGGCSGFTYELSFADGPAEDDAVIEAADGVRVLVDPKSGPIVRGSTLEYNDALLGGGLKMINPQATHECACGDSFSHLEAPGTSSRARHDQPTVSVPVIWVWNRQWNPPLATPVSVDLHRLAGPDRLVDRIVIGRERVGGLADVGDRDRLPLGHGELRSVRSRSRRSSGRRRHHRRPGSRLGRLGGSSPS